MDQNTRKLITFHKTLSLRDDIDRLNKKEESSVEFKIAWMNQYKNGKSTF